MFQPKSKGAAINLYQITAILLLFGTVASIWLGASSIGDHAHDTLRSNDVTISVKDGGQDVDQKLARAKQEFAVHTGIAEEHRQQDSLHEDEVLHGSDLKTVDQNTLLQGSDPSSDSLKNIRRGKNKDSAQRTRHKKAFEQHATDVQEDNAVLPKLVETVVLDTCHAKHNAEYDGSMVKWGADNLMDTAGDCCHQCQSTPGCNVWVWCGLVEGCGNGRVYKQCWLKHQDLNLLDLKGWQHPGIPWTSGALYSNDAMQAAKQQEANRLKALRDDPSLPLVWIDVSIKGKKVGRIVMVLFSKDSPLAAENFRALCTGEKGTVPAGHEGAGLQYHFKDKAFYRIIDRFIDQTGAGTDSVFGGFFRDDAGGLQLKHDRKGLLSMANAGRDQNSSHFSILMSAAPHLNGHYTVFGEVVEGFEVAEKINVLARGKPDNHAGMEEGAIISDAGQYRCGVPCGLTPGQVAKLNTGVA